MLLSSPITFTDNLIVDEIAMMFPAHEYLHLGAQADKSIVERTFELYNKQFTKSLYIHQHFVIDNLNNRTVLRIDSFNNRPNLAGLLEQIVLDDKPFNFSGIVIFENGIHADNLHIGQLIDNSGYGAVHEDKIFNVSEIFNDVLTQEDGVIQSMRIKGNVKFTKFPPVFQNSPSAELPPVFNGHGGSNLKVELVNGINVTEYFSLVVPQPGLNDEDPLGQKKAAPIGGVKTFSNGLKVFR